MIRPAEIVHRFTGSLTPTKEAPMATVEIAPFDHLHSHAYWAGWLGGALAEALIVLGDVDDETGEYARDRGEALQFIRSFWDTFAAGPLSANLAHRDEQVWDGFVVESQDGEAQAVRDTHREAVAAIRDVEDYWHGAETCGHPDAPGYVQALRPFRVRQITKAERDLLREYPAVIDREG
jgi:hypothetical protein